jgi:hypothetical protein
MTILYPNADSSSVGSWDIVGKTSQYEALNPVSDIDYIQIEVGTGQKLTVKLYAGGPMAFGDSYFKFRSRVIQGNSTVQVSVAFQAETELSPDNTGFVFVSDVIDITAKAWTETSIKIPDSANQLLAMSLGKIWATFNVNDKIGAAKTIFGVSSVWIDAPTVDESVFTQLSVSYPTINQLVTVETSQGRTGTAKWNGQNWLKSDDSAFEYSNTPTDVVSVKGWRL